ncbi:MAG: hypothetical protein Q7K57_39660 [Burkholderiaceae bacterium]|nr:hypothetical protein [Burkholderiaceae bacterium]
MDGLKKHAHQKVTVSASELAQMGVCERLVVFEHQYGKRRTAEQQRAAMRGLQAHARFYRERHGDLACRGRYFLGRFRYWARKLQRARYRLIRYVARWLQARESRDGP